MRRWICDRQILLRSETGVSHFVIRRRHQAVALATAVALVTWSAGATIGASWLGWHTAEQTDHLEQLSIGYAQLIARIGRDQSTRDAIGGQLADDPTLADGLIAHSRALAERVETLEMAIADAEAARAAAAGENGDLTQRLTGVEHDRERLRDEFDALVADLEAARTAIADLEGGHQAALTEAQIARLAAEREAQRRGSAEERAAALGDEVDRLSQAVQDAYEAVGQVASERDDLRRTLSQTEAEMAAALGDARETARLLRLSYANAAALRAHRNALADRLGSVTGLLEDATRRAQVAQTQIAALENLVALGRLNAGALVFVRDLLLQERTQWSGRVARLQETLTTLRDAQARLIADLRSRFEGHVESVEDALAFTGLDIDQLVAELSADGGAFGGPLLPERLDYLLDNEGWSDAPSLLAVADRASVLRDVANALPIGMPVRDDVRLSSGFGVRRDPFTGARSRHEGLDFAGPMRTPVHATAPGTVVHAGWRGAFGNLVEIEHEFGLTTRYAHLSGVDVAVGETVAYGDRVGMIGSTGRSSGPHLHYEVRTNGAARNPMNFLRAGQDVFEIADDEE